MHRLTESAQMADWLAKEETFQLDQERARAAIRIKEKRAKAIDFLALNLRYVNPIADDDPEAQDDDGLEIDLDEPYNIIEVSVCLQYYERSSVRSRVSPLRKWRSCTTTLSVAMPFPGP